MHDVHNTTVNQLVPNVISFLQKQCGRTCTFGLGLHRPESPMLTWPKP